MKEVLKTNIKMTQDEKLDNFLDLLFPLLEQDEFMAVQYRTRNGSFNKTPYKMQSNEDIKSFIRNNYNKDLYYSVATTNGGPTRKENDLISTSAIVLDFDFKDENGNRIEKPEFDKFMSDLQKKLPLYFSAEVDSGHGYQIVIAIEKTKNLKKWNEITKKLGKIYGADPKALNKTQLMRLPNSRNFKDKKVVQCNCIDARPPDEVRRYTLEKIENEVKEYEKRSKYGYYIDIKPCIKKMLEGVSKGQRNTCMGRIISFFKYEGYPTEDILKIIEEFNEKSSPPKSTKELHNEFERYWKDNPNLNGCYFPTDGKPEAERHNSILRKYCVENCLWGRKVNRNIKSNFEKPSELIEIPSRIINPINKFTGTEIALLICLFRIKHIKKGELYSNVCICERTVRKALKHLMDKNLIRIEGNDIYALNKNVDCISVDTKAATLLLNKKITNSEAKMYYTLCYVNTYEKQPTIKYLANILQQDKSNASKTISLLEEKGLVIKFVNSNTAMNYYSLKAV